MYFNQSIFDILTNSELKNTEKLTSSALALLCSDLQLKLEQELLWSSKIHLGNALY